jgi:hypothetical protein
MDVSLILADLRSRYGNKSVLTVAEIAQELGKSTKAIYALNERGGLPFPLLPDTSGLCASIYAVAEWLAGESSEKNKTQVEVESGGVPPPKRKRESLFKYMLAVKRQREFIVEFEKELEKVYLAMNVEIPNLTNEDLGRDGRL